MLERVQQLRIHSSQPSQVFGIQFVALALVGVDEPCLAGIGHQNLMTALLLEQPANPRRMGAHLDGYAQRSLGIEVAPESLRDGTQPALFDDLTAFGVQQAPIAVFVSEV